MMAVEEGCPLNAPRNAQYRYIQTHRIAGSGGAIVEGVDLSEDLPDDVIAEVRAALLENCVIFFRNQQLTPEQQLRFARRWGEIHLHPFMQGMADYPEILEVIKTPEDKKNFGGSWHTDQMFSPQPAMGTILYALEVPSAGGDTMFTNQYLVYESLSDGMKALCEQLHTVCAGDNFKQHDGVSRAARYEREMKHMKVKDPGMCRRCRCTRWCARIRKPDVRRCTSAGMCSVSTA